MASRRLPILGASLVVAAVALFAVSTTRGSSASVGFVVFSAHPDGAGAPQLFRVATTGEDLRRITSGALPAIAPSFRPDGKRIVFARLGTGIFSVGVDGTGLRRLTSKARDSYPVWSPDGKRIAFVRLHRNQFRAFTMSATGTQQRRLALAPPAGRPSWRADGKAIFVPSAGDLVEIDARTGRVLRYSGVTLDIQTGQTAAVSPNGRLVAFVAPRRSTGPPDCGEGRCQQFGLYLAGVPAPHRPRLLLKDTGAPGWSPDGTSIAYVSSGAITLREIASGKETAIATGAHVADGDSPPAWQPR